MKKIITFILLIFIVSVPFSALVYHLFRAQIHSLNVKQINPLNGTGLNPLLPDSYSCYDECLNRCTYDVIKFGLFYFNIGGLCTLMGCPEDYSDDEDKLCFENWKYSRRFHYDAFSSFTNNCLNGYKNITYPKYLQRISSLENEPTPKNFRIAISDGIRLCRDLEKSLKQGGFNEAKLLSFGSYLRIRPLPKISKEYQINIDKERIDNIKEVFDRIITNPEITNDAVTTEMIEEFEESYREYANKKS